MNIEELKKEIKRKRKNDKIKIILSIGCNTSLIQNILKDDYSILTIENIKIYEEIYYPFLNIKDDLIFINIGINMIDKLGEINKIMKPVIILINSVDTFFYRIQNIIYRYMIRGLKKLKNKTLIINTDDKNLNKIYLNNLDIYRVGKENTNIIYYDKDKLFYQDKDYKLKYISSELLINIVVLILFGYDIDNIIKKIQ